MLIVEGFSRLLYEIVNWNRNREAALEEDVRVKIS